MEGLPARAPGNKGQRRPEHAATCTPLEDVVARTPLDDAAAGVHSRWSARKSMRRCPEYVADRTPQECKETYEGCVA